MKYRIFTIAVVIALVVAGFAQIKPVSATGWGTKFITSITYQNVGTGSSEVQIDFYPEGSGTPITYTANSIAQNAGNSIMIGTLSLTGFNQGSAIMSSTQPLVATLVQLPQLPSTVKNRPLSTGFTSGAAEVLLPTALKNHFATTSIFTIQNVDTDPADVTVAFKKLDAGTDFTTTVSNLAVGASKYFDLSQVTQIGADFNGSVQIKSVKHATTTAGAVVATSMELKLNTDDVYAFEGVSGSANTVYMPSAMCNFGSEVQNSAYAIMNVDAVATANVTITYSNTHTDTFTIAPLKKVSKFGCGVLPGSRINPDGFLGSAKIVSTGAKIVAMGKIGSMKGLGTAFVGVTQGAAKYALPYVRFTNDNWSNGKSQRANIAIQNIGTTDLAAGAVTVKYYDATGTLVGTHPLGALAAGAKLSSNATIATLTSGLTNAKLLTEFGYVQSTGTGIGGGVIVQGPAGSLLAVIVRVQTYNPANGQIVGEDYNGVPIQ